MKKIIIKGFTLVEVIVVMVIIAILAALMMPSLTKYINKAEAQQTIIDARQFYTASQAVISEAYALSAKNINRSATSTANSCKLKTHPVTGKTLPSAEQVNCARLSSMGFQRAQHIGPVEVKNDKNMEKNQITNYNAMLSQKILDYVDSYDTDDPVFLFDSDTAKPTNTTPSEYYSKYKTEQPMICVYFDKSGKVILVEYADKSLYKVTIYKGELTVTYDGRFANA